jgi:hypothetical protein
MPIIKQRQLLQLKIHLRFFLWAFKQILGHPPTHLVSGDLAFSELKLEKSKLNVVRLIVIFVLFHNKINFVMILSVQFNY